MSLTNLSDIKVNFLQEVPSSNKQMPEFYACGGTKDYAHVTKGLREVFVAVNGEMSLTIPVLTPEGQLDDSNPNIIRYGDELDKMFRDDLSFMQFVKTISNSGFEIYRMNPWWEVYSLDYPDGEVYETFSEALEAAIDFINDDEYWDDSLEGMDK